MTPSDFLSRGQKAQQAAIEAGALQPVAGRGARMDDWAVLGPEMAAELRKVREIIAGETVTENLVDDVEMLVATLARIDALLARAA